MIGWPTGVNKVILNETTGTFGDGLIQDTTTSGKKKTRLRSTAVPDTYPVVMSFEKSEFEIFETWFKQYLRYGTLTFQFPKIAGTGYGEYRITKVSWGNPGGNIIRVTMAWEEA